jgi:hypothetical protein
LRSPCFPEEKTNNPYPLLTVIDAPTQPVQEQIRGTLLSAAQAKKWGNDTYGESEQNRTIASANSKSPRPRIWAQSQRQNGSIHVITMYEGYGQGTHSQNLGAK